MPSSRVLSRLHILPYFSSNDAGRRPIASWNGLITWQYLRLLLPAASKRAVQLHDRDCFVFLGDGESELSRVVVSVVS
jgi:hypothetical protein